MLDGFGEVVEPDSSLEVSGSVVAEVVSSVVVAVSSAACFGVAPVSSGTGASAAAACLPDDTSESGSADSVTIFASADGSALAAAGETCWVTN